MEWEQISSAISEATGKQLRDAKPWPIGGGSINSAFRLEDSQHAYFVKVNRCTALGMFQAEAAGLSLLAQPSGPRVPAVITLGTAQEYAYLVLEYIPLRSGNPPGFALLGERLAALHRITQPHYGWEYDNTIGSTPQINTPNKDWVAFYRLNRLEYQLDLAARNGWPALRNATAPLLENLAFFFTGYRPAPSLLHGDLWSGNAAIDREGRPVIFDPACYFGDRESDLAMTELFGSFSNSFYDAYQTAWPLDPGYAVRRDLYQLYHVLNHLNLFGAGYLSQSQRLIERLLAELG